MKNRDQTTVLIVICALALALRLPGVFWGVQLHNEPKFITYNGNETTLIRMAPEFIGGFTWPGDYYPKGVPFMVSLAGSAIKPFTALDQPQLTIIGRSLSV